MENLEHEHKQFTDHEEHDCDFAATPTPPPAAQPEEVHLALLPPNHPLLARFQQLLKEYMLRTKEQLTNDIAVIKYNVKLKEQQREEQGAKLYDMQQEIHHQNVQLEEYAHQAQEHFQQRRKEEEAVVQLKLEYEEKLQGTKEQKQLYNKRMTELENMQTLENHIRKWSDDVEDDVKNAKSIVNRDAQLQKQLSEDKRKSDMLFYHLDMEVKKGEKELVEVRDEAVDMRQCIEILETSIYDANSDLEALQNEHKRLTQAWGEVIVAISHRDKIAFQVQRAIEKEKEFIQLSTSSIEAIKKQISKEMDQSNKLEGLKIRLVNDFTNLKRECQKESDTLSTLEAKLQELPLFLEQTEKDLKEAKKEGSALEIEIRRMQWKIDKQSNTKFKIEENILSLAHDQLITDKASIYRLKLLGQAQEHRRSMELTLSQTQNQLAETMLELERSKSQHFRMQQDGEKLKANLDIVEKNSSNQDAEYKTIENLIEVKLKRIEKLSRELEELTQAMDGTQYSPTQRKIKEIEKELHDAEQMIRGHQQFWLMLQNHFINLSQKRNIQLNEIQVTRKQLSIIKQKTLRIDQDLEKSEETTRDLNRDIQIYTAKVELLNEKMFLKRHQHETVENDCELEHSDLLHRLKDNEMLVLKLESDIDELQTDIEHYKDLVLDKHREALSWETKYKLIEETMRWRKDEFMRNGEIGVMKTEIHRMEIRHNQLKVAQEKLMKDLKQCVLHREQIFVAASTKQLIAARPQRSKAATTLQQRVVDLRNKLKQVQNEIGTITDQQMEELNRERERINSDCKKIRADIEQEIAQYTLQNVEIDEGVLLKHNNLENIVRKQNRAKAYRRLNSSSIPPKMPRSEMSLQSQSQKQSDINDALVDIAQTLSSEYPEKKNFFIKVLQILKD